MVTPLDVLLHVPLASAAVWFANASWPWLRGLRTASERAFVAMCVFLGLWTFLDWLFLRSSGDVAILVSKFQISMLTLASLAMFYFGRWLSRPRGTFDILALIPVVITITIAWTALTGGVERVWWGPRPLLDPRWYVVWVAQVGTYVLLSFYYLGTTFRHVTFSSPETRTKLLAIFAALVVAMGSWLVADVYNNLTQSPGFPASSALVLIPGILLLVFLAPESTERLLAMLRRLIVTPARPFAAVWYHSSGQPLAEVLLPGEKALDASVLADLTRAVDHVVTKGLHAESGSLREMTAGEVRFLFERGQHLTLVVLLRGRPPEALRSELRLAVRDFEEVHGDRLATWESAANLAESALKALEDVLNPTML